MHISSTHLLLVLVCLVCPHAIGAADIIIDDFTTAQSNAVSQARGSGIIGGERELTEKSGLSVTLTGNGQLSTAKTTGSAAYAHFVYDGEDPNVGLPYSATGLGGIELTAGGELTGISLNFTLVQSYTVTLTINCTDGGQLQHSEKYFDNSPFVAEVLFDDMTGTGDPSAVRYIELDIGTVGSTGALKLNMLKATSLPVPSPTPSPTPLATPLVNPFVISPPSPGNYELVFMPAKGELARRDNRDGTLTYFDREI
eukprot:TRINITY_DN5128_c0_g1_i1.p1 TRINITY_DN5128_c0_g1~~TRINITY_DN5128_c0_g1_i1.p1  ORF type:complete len:264 (-),score=51.60 TRINITY_DN5128_c0_g1_i1:34-798(-)